MVIVFAIKWIGAFGSVMDTNAPVQTPLVAISRDITDCITVVWLPISLSYLCY